MPLFDCLSCDCYQPHNREHPERGGVCHGKPPSAQFIGMQAQPQQGPLVGIQHQVAPQPIFVYVYTAVGKGDWCALHPMYQAMRRARPVPKLAPMSAVPGSDGKPLPIALADVDDENPLPGEVKPGSGEKPS